MTCDALSIISNYRGELLVIIIVISEICRVNYYLALRMYWVRGCKHVYIARFFVWLLQLDFSWLQIFLFLNSEHNWGNFVKVRFDKCNLRFSTQVSDQHEERAPAIFDTTSFRQTSVQVPSVTPCFVSFRTEKAQNDSRPLVLVNRLVCSLSAI